MGIDGQGSINQVALVNLHVHHTRNHLRLDSFQLDPARGHTLWDRFTLADSELTNISGAPVCGAALAIYASANRLALLGNDLNNSGGGSTPYASPRRGLP